ncbi:MAG TPA: nucleotidyl transferase AbiEii/AbiGii toxin family protein [Solirubrobacterales bacterium]
MVLSDVQIVELFHVSFLETLSRRLEPSRYVLKGGANLRYFFDSVRYSEDIDLDLLGVPAWSLEAKVDALLEKGPLGLLLRPAGVAVAEFSKPKQTDTTQRWKIGLAAPDREELIRTKVEFSHREGAKEFRLEGVQARIVEPYALRAPSVQHYTGDVPTEQKVEALAERNETQARDVFDLDLLLRRGPLPAGSVSREIVEAAIARALELPFDAFRGQVLPFLEPEVAEIYDGAAWEQMQTFVAGKLEESV